MQIEVTDWMSSYYRTCVARDVRDFLAVGDLETFSRFIRLCAGRSGQILNLSSLSAPFEYWLGLPGNRQKNGVLVYGGQEAYIRDRFVVRPWYGCS